MMGPNAGRNKPGFRPLETKQQAPQVEVERVDTSTLVSPKKKVAPLRSNEDFEEVKNTGPSKEALEKARKEREEKQPPPELQDPIPDPVDVIVTDDLLARLNAKYGGEESKFYDFEVYVKGQAMSLTVRKPEYEDGMWVLGVLSGKAKRGEDISLMMEATQREELMKHILASRVVVKIDGNWVWDIFKATRGILEVNPSWDGQDPLGIPDFLQGTIAISVYNFFRRLDPNLPFQVGAKVEEITAAARKKATEDDGDEEEEAAEDPTPGT
jgi:hypothetical protein